ncbi:thioester domain-containing protein [Cellulomonas dongxiuzhuiae]|uniref:Thioester domain-containing protein n=1 Tax=Cellulomonas dongxiuzhuiae TaxID=2819979 RepID=A0ABX8GHT1_9CELL|nr:thioester domain-containing protein [Cellulomonas dongxiuzhuiae]MBO3094412.1 thioester domain-containing protein [Cellulomonas dongxiuzhuiae]QWC15440.1 thioester domain-containing protein [Cellulomonas dongxiuzhuiae]
MTGRRLARWGASRCAAVAVFAGLLLALGVAPAPAIIILDPPPVTPVDLPATDLVIATPPNAVGQRLTGFLPPVGATFDPTAGYPSGNPTGYDPGNPSFAGTGRVAVEDTGEILPFYCVQSRVGTFSGLGYTNTTWAESNVQNTGYVARIVNSYYPVVPTEPAAAANDNQRGAAVQAAIWFFTDGYIVSTADPVRPLVESIVAATLLAGPLAEPSPPAIAITPASASGAAGALVGPLTVTATATDGAPTDATLDIPAGVTAYSDAAGTVEVASGAPVASGTQIWLRGTTPGTVSLGATATVDVPAGTIYLYDGNTPGQAAAQTIMLAQTGNIKADTTAAVELFAAGSLVVDKTIAGAAAGAQGEVVLDVACTLDGTPVLGQSITLPAGSPAGTTSSRYDGIPVGSACTVTEPTTGQTAALGVVTASTGDVTITADTDAVITVTNTYDPARNAGSSDGAPALAVTGADFSRPLAALAVGLLVAGLALVGASRRWGTRRG